MSLFAQGGVPQINRLTGTANAVQGFNAFGSPIEGPNRDTPLPSSVLMMGEEGFAQQPLIPVAAPTTKFWININGTWKESTLKVNVNGTWKTASIKVNSSGTWY
jgi:hypothetical protein